MTVLSRGAPDPYPDSDPAGYPVDLVDPVRIRPDPKSLGPAGIRIWRDRSMNPARSRFCIYEMFLPVTLNIRGVSHGIT